MDQPTRTAGRDAAARPARHGAPPSARSAARPRRMRPATKPPTSPCCAKSGRPSPSNT